MIYFLCAESKCGVFKVKFMLRLKGGCLKLIRFTLTSTLSLCPLNKLQQPPSLRFQTHSDTH